MSCRVVCVCVSCAVADDVCGGRQVNDGMPKGKNVKRAEKVVGGPMTSTKLFKQLTQENQAAKGGKLPTKAPRQQDAPTGARKDTGFKL